MYVNFVSFESAMTDDQSQADRINALEIEHNWGEEDFDFVLQYIRTLLMKRKRVLCPVVLSSR